MVVDISTLSDDEIASLSDDEITWLLQSLAEDDPLRQEILEYLE